MTAQLIDPATGLRRVVNGIFPSNSYILPTGHENGCILIDPGLDGDRIEAALQEAGLRPIAILCTHGHFDHIGSAARFQENGAPVWLPAADLKLAKASNFLLMALKIDARIKVPVPDHAIGPGHRAQIAGRDVVFHGAPGHTPGSMVITINHYAFTGDTIYARSVGMSGLPGEDPAVLRASITRLLQDLPPAMLALPGHGEAATLEQIATGNTALRAFLAAS